MFSNAVSLHGDVVPLYRDSLRFLISFILDSGECFVGDLEPMEFLGGYEQNEQSENDWELIMSYAPKVIFYAHANEKIL